MNPTIQSIHKIFKGRTVIAKRDFSAGGQLFKKGCIFHYTWNKYNKTEQIILFNHPINVRIYGRDFIELFDPQ